jgi:Flp pilus assembly protein TadD
MNASTPEDIAFALFESGHLPEAERAWREILSRKPEDPDALHMLGYILATTGRGDEGIALIDRAIAKAPRVAGFRSNRAVALHGLGRDAEAERDLRRALDLEPRLPAALHLLGNIHLKQGRATEAATAYRRALAVAPRMVAAHVGLGGALMRRGDREGARKSLEAALRLDPNDADVHYNLGTLLDAQADGRAEEAYRQTLKLRPDHVAAHNELGVWLRRAGREDEARPLFERAAGIAPTNASVLSNLGISRIAEQRFEDAIDLFRRALEARPGFAEALVNWGNALQELDRLDEAAQRYHEALQAVPGLGGARYGVGCVALREQRFAAGWDGWEARFDEAMGANLPRGGSIARLARAEVDEPHRVAVWKEQGLGDQLVYSTLLPELEGRRIEVVIEIDERLIPAYRRRFPTMQVVADKSGDAIFAGCDRQVPLGSLPGLFRPTLESFGRQPAALLRADPARVEEMRARLGPGRWIAVAWRSLQKGDRQPIGERKSIPLETFAGLAGAGGARLLDLQYGDVDAERAEFHARHPGALTRIEGLDTKDDLEGVLAAIEACERVVTSSNALAHLAGALGKPTSVLLRGGRAPFHYWIAGPDGRCLWYPSVEIVTDVAWTRWDQVLDAVARRLAAAG